MSTDATGLLRAGLEQGLAAYEAAQTAYDALIDGCHRITPEYLQQEAALEAARDAALCALPARSELARMLLRALAAQAEAGAVLEERLRGQLATYRGLYDLPRLEGGVLSIAHDIHPERPIEELSRTVLRHERRGYMRQVELDWRDDPLEALTRSPWQAWTASPGDLVEALKRPMPTKAPHAAALAAAEEVG